MPHRYYVGSFFRIPNRHDYELYELVRELEDKKYAFQGRDSLELNRKGHKKFKEKIKKKGFVLCPVGPKSSTYEVRKRRLLIPDFEDMPGLELIVDANSPLGKNISCAVGLTIPEHDTRREIPLSLNERARTILLREMFEKHYKPEQIKDNRYDIITKEDVEKDEKAILMFLMSKIIPIENKKSKSS